MRKFKFKVLSFMMIVMLLSLSLVTPLVAISFAESSPFTPPNITELPKSGSNPIWAEQYYGMSGEEYYSKLLERLEQGYDGIIEYDSLDFVKMVLNKKGDCLQIQLADPVRGIGLIFDFYIPAKQVKVLKTTSMSFEYSYTNDLLNIFVDGECFYSDELGIN